MTHHCERQCFFLLFTWSNIWLCDVGVGTRPLGMLGVVRTLWISCFHWVWYLLNMNNTLNVCIVLPKLPFVPLRQCANCVQLNSIQFIHVAQILQQRSSQGTLQRKINRSSPFISNYPLDLFIWMLYKGFGTWYNHRNIFVALTLTILLVLIVCECVWMHLFSVLSCLTCTQSSQLLLLWVSLFA